MKIKSGRRNFTYIQSGQTRLTTPIHQAMARCNKCRSCRQAAMRRAGGARSPDRQTHQGMHPEAPPQPRSRCRQAALAPCLTGDLQGSRRPAQPDGSGYGSHQGYEGLVGVFVAVLRSSAARAAHRGQARLLHLFRASYASGITSSAFVFRALGPAFVAPCHGLSGRRCQPCLFDMAIVLRLIATRSTDIRQIPGHARHGGPASPATPIPAHAGCTAR